MGLIVAKYAINCLFLLCVSKIQTLVQYIFSTKTTCQIVCEVHDNQLEQFQMFIYYLYGTKAPVIPDMSGDRESLVRRIISPDSTETLVDTLITHYENNKNATVKHIRTTFLNDR